MKPNIALLLGASGSVGFEVLQALLESPAYEKVVVYVRKPFDPLKISSKKLVQKIVPEMTGPALSTAVAETVAEFSNNKEVELKGFSALGVGANTAKLTIEEHRAIDVLLNQTFAQALKASNVEYLAFLSAIGANPKAKATGSGAAGMPRYARVKGEAEEAVRAHGPKVVDIFRPSIIRGSQHTPKYLSAVVPVVDFLIPKKYHSISTEQIAQAMVAASLGEEKAAETYEYSEMVRVIQGSR